jgi:hypothetical protein
VESSRRQWQPYVEQRLRTYIRRRGLVLLVFQSEEKREEVNEEKRRQKEDREVGEVHGVTSLLRVFLFFFFRSGDCFCV